MAFFLPFPPPCHIDINNGRDDNPLSKEACQPRGSRSRHVILLPQCGVFRCDVILCARSLLISRDSSVHSYNNRPCGLVCQSRTTHSGTATLNSWPQSTPASLFSSFHSTGCILKSDAFGYTMHDQVSTYIHVGRNGRSLTSGQGHAWP